MDEDNPDDDSEEQIEVASRSWVSMDEKTNEFQCLWPTEKLTAAQQTALVTKHVKPAESWRAHKCELIKAYSKSSTTHSLLLTFTFGLIWAQLLRNWGLFNSKKESLLLCL